MFKSSEQYEECQSLPQLIKLLDYLQKLLGKNWFFAIMSAIQRVFSTQG